MSSSSPNTPPRGPAAQAPVPAAPATRPHSPSPRNGNRPSVNGGEAAAARRDPAAQSPAQS
jgi:hypothetical protein